MLKDLENYDEIAVDYESSIYDYKFHGWHFCLIQISTRDKTYIIDAFLLSQSFSPTKYFCNNQIIKIFHAAVNDLLAS